MQKSIVVSIRTIQIVGQAGNRITTKKPGITDSAGQDIDGDTPGLSRASHRLIAAERLAVGGKNLNQRNGQNGTKQQGNHQLDQ